jgi:hypothetical protein
VDSDKAMTERQQMQRKKIKRQLLVVSYLFWILGQRYEKVLKLQRKPKKSSANCCVLLFF